MSLLLNYDESDFHFQSLLFQLVSNNHNIIVEWKLDLGTLIWKLW